MIAVLFVSTAGIGALGRWLLAARWNQRLPLGTLMANTVASFAVGVCNSLDGDADILIRVALFGSFSTWSTLAFEITRLARDGRRPDALLHLMSSLVLGIGAAWLGLRFVT
mgnify:CR=1 FL=1|jgi:fluoride exporter